MQLKRVTVCGFKSFADKVDFEFGPGVTCIVGPNGCGKSNVVDAFKWVLGEQSARSLRGRQMSDMIFNGSSTRKSSAWPRWTWSSTTPIGPCVDQRSYRYPKALPLRGERVLINGTSPEGHPRCSSTPIGVMRTRIEQDGTNFPEQSGGSTVIFEEAAGSVDTKPATRGRACSNGPTRICFVSPTSSRS